MSLEDHNITYIMDVVKQETVPIVDIDHIEHELDKQTSSTCEADRRRDAEQRLRQTYNEKIKNEPTSDEEILPQVPELRDDEEPFSENERKLNSDHKDGFHYYSRLLQYMLNKATKGEPRRFALQCNRNNSSGFETWRQLEHLTHDQGERAHQLHTLNRVMKPNRVSASKRVHTTN
eukprot:4880759-Amphidinium_carterae.1